jgi:hypothetical protein
MPFCFAWSRRAVVSLLVLMLTHHHPTIIAVQADDTNNDNCVGYQDRIDLSSTVTLEYTVQLDDPNDTASSEFPQGILSGRLTYSGLGWVAFGISAEKGRMIGGQAIVGEPDRDGVPLVYDLDGYLPRFVTPAAQSSQLLDDGNTAVEQDEARTILTFRKVLVDGTSIPIKGNGANSFIWAHGFNNFFPQTHQQKGAFILNLRPCNVVMDDEEVLGDGFEEIDVAGGSYKNLWSAHGWLAGIAWGVLTPLAISASLLRDFFPRRIWLKFHMALNMFTVCMTLAAFGIAVAALKKSTPEGEDAGQFSTDVAHRTVGLVLTIVVVMQALGGMARPHTPKEHDANNNKSKVRTVWEIGHRLFGFGLLGGAAWQVQEGIKLYLMRFPDAKDLKPIFWGVFGGILGAAFVGHVYSRLVLGNKTKKGSSSIEKVIVDEEIPSSSSGTSGQEESDGMAS